MRNLEIVAVHEGNTINAVDIGLSNGTILKEIPYFDEYPKAVFHGTKTYIIATVD